MSLESWLAVGERIDLGAHVFEADAIKAFAAKYDPQPFHMDEAAAARSVFGRLCASGWHTAATWMKYNLEHRPDVVGAPWDGPGRPPVFGPSPGFTNLKWPKPVYVGETIRFTRIPLAVRQREGRPGWYILTMRAEAHDSAGDKVLEFDSAVILQPA